MRKLTLAGSISLSWVSDRLGIVASIGSEYLLDGAGSQWSHGLYSSGRGGSHGVGVRLGLGDRVGGVDRGMDMGWLNRDNRVVGMDMDWFMWDNSWSYGNNWDHGGHYGGAERGSLGRGGTGLVRPGVAGEPLGRDEILTGGVGRVNIAPLGSSTVHSQTVALHHSVSVPEGEAAALTPTVYQRRGGLGLRVLHLHGAGGGDDGEGAEESEEDDVTAVLHGEDICW